MKTKGEGVDFKTDKLHYIQPPKPRGRITTVRKWPRFPWPVRVYDNLTARLYKVLSTSR